MCMRPSGRVLTTSLMAGPAPRVKCSTNFGFGMAYRVELTDRAKRDLGDLYVHIDATEAAAAARWLNGLEEAITALRPFRGVARWRRRQHGPGDSCGTCFTATSPMSTVPS